MCAQSGRGLLALTFKSVSVSFIESNINDSEFQFLVHF